MSTLLAKILPTTTGAFVDVGVNRLRTFFDLRSIDPSRTYVGIEPNIACVSYAWSVFSASSVSDALVIAAAASDREELLEFWLDPSDPFDASATIVGDLRPGRNLRKTVVPAVTVDGLMERLSVSRVGLVKIDVEGAELLVLRGMRRVLEEDQPIVLCEVLDRDSKADAAEFSARIEEVYRFIDSCGYDLYAIQKDPGQKKFSHLVKLDRFPDRVYERSREHECDYLFWPRGSRMEGAESFLLSRLVQPTS